MNELPDQTGFGFSEGEEQREFLSGRIIVSKQEKTKSGRGRKSLKEAEAEDNVQVPDDDVLFQKQYYAIGEVIAYVGCRGQ